jgi:predicted DNA-binding transcriptional regulator AlpA
VLSPWVNERCPPINDILSAHDVARLTRRPRWVLIGLCLVGRFPKKARFRGRALGWRRTEVLGWMARDLAVAPACREHLNAPKQRSHRHSRQACLPLECREPCHTTRKPQGTQKGRDHG